MLIDPAVYLAYCGTVVLLALAPGTDNIYILTQTLSRGRHAGLLAALGIAGALCIHVTAVTFGLAQLFVNAPTLFQAVKWAGIAYLAWLAWGAFRSAGAASWQIGATADHRAAGAGRTIAKGFALALLNPKLAVFFIAFLPQFTDPTAGGITLQLLTLGITFAVISLSLFTAMIFVVAPMGDWLRRHPGFPVWQARLTGTVLGGMAFWLALDEA